MFTVMRSFALLLACAACTGHGRRIQSSLDRLPGETVQLKALATLLRSIDRAVAFAPSGIGRPISAPRPTATAPVMQFEFLEKVGDKAKEALGIDKGMGGLSPEENAEIEERMKRGEMSFEDFLKQCDLIEKGQAMKQLTSKIGGNKQEVEQLEQTRKKLMTYKEYVDVMTEDEKKDPQILIDEALRAQKANIRAPNLERIAEASEHTVEEVGKFLLEFRLMRSAAGKFASGGDPDEIRREMQEEAANSGDGGAVLNRQQRRAQKKALKKKAAKSKGFGR